MAQLQHGPQFHIDADLDQNSLRDYIEKCQDCHQACLETLNYCFQNEVVGTEAPLLQRLVDCAQLCQIAADFLIRKSEIYVSLCRLCAHACRLCAKECEVLSDRQLKDCEEACYRCAEACNEVEIQH